MRAVGTYWKKQSLLALVFVTWSLNSFAQESPVAKRIDSLFHLKKIAYADKKHKAFPHATLLPVVDFGVSGYNAFGQDNSMDSSSVLSTASTALNYRRSRNLGIHFHLTYNLSKNIGIVSGLGFSSNTYNFSNNLTLEPKSGAFLADTVTSYTRYRFRNNYLQVPLLLKLQTPNDRLQVAIGGVLGYNILTKTKADYIQNDISQRLVTKGSFGVNPLKLSLLTRVNYRGFGLYFRYGLNRFIDIQNAGSKNQLRAFEAGISIGEF